MEAMTFRELCKHVSEQDAANKARGHFVEVEGNSIMIYSDPHMYDIELGRVKTRDDLLSWVFHLSEKGWMTIDLLRSFMDRAAAANNIQLYRKL